MFESFSLLHTLHLEYKLLSWHLRPAAFIVITSYEAQFSEKSIQHKMFALVLSTTFSQFLSTQEEFSDILLYIFFSLHVCCFDRL
jgi:hypothetical protein